MFKNLKAPSGKMLFIPQDIDIKFPQITKVGRESIHSLARIPWDDKYFKIIPKKFLEFFKFVKPYLSVRTTDVHTAISLSLFKEITNKFPKTSINKKLIGVALTLHDCGWSKVSDEEITQTFTVKGLNLNKNAIGPKEKHVVEGEKIAREILDCFNFMPPLTKQEKNIICQAVLFHDKPEEVTKNGKMPLEVKLVVDLDHLWGFSHEAFWLDIIRKNVSPEKYWNNLNHELKDYFTTKEGTKKAKQLLKERKEELVKPPRPKRPGLPSRCRLKPRTVPI